MPTPQKPFPQIWCAHCGYPLRALHTHRCPECGETFGDQFIIFGWPASYLTRQPKRPHGCLIAFAVYLLLVSFGTYESGLWLPAIIYVAIATIIATFYPAARLLRAARGPRPLRPRSQLRLAPEGYGSRQGFGPVNLWSWTRHMDITIAPIKDRAYRIRLVRTTEIGTMQWNTLTEITCRASPKRIAQIRVYILTQSLKAPTDSP